MPPLIINVNVCRPTQEASFIAFVGPIAVKTIILTVAAALALISIQSVRVEKNSTLNYTAAFNTEVQSMT